MALNVKCVMSRFKFHGHECFRCCWNERVVGISWPTEGNMVHGGARSYFNSFMNLMNYSVLHKFMALSALHFPSGY